MHFGGELKSIRGQSVGEDHAGLQLVEKLAKPLTDKVVMVPQNKNSPLKNCESF